MSALDVLAANVAVANTTRQNDRYTSIVTCADCAMEAREALAAIADLIEALCREATPLTLPDLEVQLAELGRLVKVDRVFNSSR